MKADGPRARPKHLRRPARRSAGEGERIFEGLGVSPGIAIGPAHVHEAGNVAVPEHTIASGEVEAERQRFRGAVEKSLRQLGKLGTKADSLPPSVSEEIGFLLEAHRQMLSQSRLVRGVERRIVEDHMNAEAAVQAEIAAITQSFGAMDDAYLAARVQDVREVGTRLTRNLTQTPFQAFKSLPEGTVGVAEEITPADTALMDPERLAGFCTVLGGAEGHTAIMARAMGLPAVLGVAGLIGQVRAGDMVIVDGSHRQSVLPPNPATLDAPERRPLSLLRHQPPPAPP